MTTDKLKLNDGKTEFIIIGTRAQLDKINITKLGIDQVKVSAVISVRNLGTWFDNHLTITTAINTTCQSGLYHLHNIRHIKRFLSFEDRKSIVQAIVMSQDVVLGHFGKTGVLRRPAIVSLSTSQEMDNVH